MKKIARLTLLFTLFAFPAAVALADDTPDPAATRAEMMEKMRPAMMEKIMPGMGLRQGAPADAKPCMNGSAPPCRQHKMGNAPMMSHGMGPNRMEHDLYIDRADELGLSDEQVTQLKKIRSECRKDNIRTGAELKITRFELADLQEAKAGAAELEKLVRKSKTLEGDIEIRHLRAKADAKKVLTADQLKKAETQESLEDLF